MDRTKKLDPRTIDPSLTRQDIGYYTQIDREKAGYDRDMTLVLSRRLNAGWTVGRAMSTPLQGHGGARRGEKYEYVDSKVSKNTVYRRRRIGRTMEEAINTPLNKGRTTKVNPLTLDKKTTKHDVTESIDWMCTGATIAQAIAYRCRWSRGRTIHRTLNTPLGKNLHKKK